MTELTDEQVRAMRTQHRPKAKAETPPTLTDEDEKLLDEAWKDAKLPASAGKAAHESKSETAAKMIR